MTLANRGCAFGSALKNNAFCPDIKEKLGLDAPGLTRANPRTRAFISASSGRTRIFALPPSKSSNSSSALVEYMSSKSNQEDEDLEMDDFVLPPSESTRILKDKEIICVKRKEMALVEAIQGADAEFDKETGGCQSESEDAKDEKLEDEPSPIQTTSKKIKASKTSRSSKKKKHRTVMDVVEDEVVTEENNINNDKFCPMKIIKPRKKKGVLKQSL
ncbi:unnamed protein product [Lactuca saligna]|uniref:Coilin n=1 Tax=Lactuca saligna TaxID=75948 RepID=A0AA36ENC7_LACSI|nr:unnamed protein product [Lactuca saligna]